MLYASGRGVSLDYKKAMECWKESHELGFPAAAYNIGILYLSGKGVGSSKDEAHRWFALSCRGGYRDACSAAGSIGKKEGGRKESASAGKKDSRKGAAGGKQQSRR